MVNGRMNLKLIFPYFITHYPNTEDSDPDMNGRSSKEQGGGQKPQRNPRNPLQ